MNDLKTYYLVNSDLVRVALIETYESMIWTNRYWEAGDFELYLPANKESMALYTKAANEGWYILQDDNDVPATQKQMMIITNVTSETDSEGGNHLSITGKSLKSLLNRRIVISEPIIAGNIEEEIRRIVDENAVNPKDGDRAIPGLILGDYLKDKNGNRLINDVINFDATGLQMDKAISDMCKVYKLGWDIVYDMIEGNFKFVLTKGLDRTNNQTIALEKRNPYVIFSDDYENLLTTKYTLNNTNYRNICYVKGELTFYNEETKQNYTEDATQVVTPKNVETVSYTGINRRELYIDGKSQSKDYENFPEVYMYALQTKGQAELEKYEATTDITGKVLSNYTFEINKDFFIGDLVTVVNCYGQWFDARVTEVIHTEETRGITTIPSFIVENYADKKKDNENPDPAKIRYTEDNLIRVTEQGSIRYIEYGYREEVRTCLVVDPTTKKLVEVPRTTEDDQPRTVNIVDKPKN